MLRPGPKTRLEDVKTSIVLLLRDNPEGLNFNEIFRRLKERKVLGSFSILDKAMKDLTRSKVTFYREVNDPRYKLPMRIYALTQHAEQIVKNYETDYTPNFWDSKTLKEAEYLEKFAADLLKELSLEKCSDAVLLRSLLIFASNLTYVYDLIVSENGNPDGEWKILFNSVLSDEREFMENIAKKANSHKVWKEGSLELANRMRKALSRLIMMLAVRADRLAGKESAETKSIRKDLGLSL